MFWMGVNCDGIFPHVDWKISHLVGKLVQSETSWMKNMMFPFHYKWDLYGTAVAVIGAFGDDFCRRLLVIRHHRSTTNYRNLLSWPCHVVLIMQNPYATQSSHNLACFCASIMLWVSTRVIVLGRNQKPLIEFRTRDSGNTDYSGQLYLYQKPCYRWLLHSSPQRSTVSNSDVLHYSCFYFLKPFY